MEYDNNEVKDLTLSELDEISGGSAAAYNACVAGYSGLGAFLGGAATSETGGWGAILGGMAGSWYGSNACRPLMQ